MMLFATEAGAQNWTFGAVSDADKANLSADATHWTHETAAKTDRYNSNQGYNKEALIANNTELSVTKGLLFTAS